jgi:hypothetical protein
VDGPPPVGRAGVEVRSDKPDPLQLFDKLLSMRYCWFQHVDCKAGGGTQRDDTQVVALCQRLARGGLMGIY